MMNLPSLQLLLSFLLLVSSPASAAAQEKVAYECSKWQTSETLTFGCKNGYRIQILRAFYGYSHEEKHCFYEPGDCYEETLIDQCSGVTRCTAIVEKSSMGACGWSFHDYLQIHYTCRPGSPGPDISNNDKRSGFPPGNFDATKLVNAGQVTACVVGAVVVFAILAVGGATIYRKKRRRHSDDEFSSSDFSNIINAEDHLHPRGGPGGGGGSTQQPITSASAHPSIHGGGAISNAAAAVTVAAHDTQYSASLKRGAAPMNNNNNNKSSPPRRNGSGGGQTVVLEESRNKRTNNNNNHANSRLSRGSDSSAGGQSAKNVPYYHHNQHSQSYSASASGNRHHPIYTGGCVGNNVGVNNVNKASSTPAVHPVGFIQMQNIRDPSVTASFASAAAAAANSSAYPSYVVAATAPHPPPPPPPPLHPRLGAAAPGSEVSSSDLEDDAGESRPGSVGISVAPMLPPRRYIHNHNNNNNGVYAPAALATASYAQIRGYDDDDDDDDDDDPPPSYEEAASFFDTPDSRLNNGSCSSNINGMAFSNNGNAVVPATTTMTTMDNRQIVLNGPSPFLVAALSNGAAQAESHRPSGVDVDESSAATKTTSTAVEESVDDIDAAVEDLVEEPVGAVTAAVPVSANNNNAVETSAEAANLDQSEGSIVATTPLLAASTSTNEGRDENDVVVVVPTQELLSSVGNDELTSEF